MKNINLLLLTISLFRPIGHNRLAQMYAMESDLDENMAENYFMISAYI